MKALLLEAVGRLRPVAVPPPKPGPNEVVLLVSHCAVCRTDAKMWHEGHRDLILPRILGHEICAFDEASGGRFVVWPGKACGECATCRAGLENLCRQMTILGFHRDGGYAELVAAPASSLIPVPALLAGHLACLAEPLACTLNALEQIRLSRGKSILIYGGGSMGLFMAMAAREIGAEPFLVETNRRKLERSEEFRTRFGIPGSVESNRTEFDAVVNATPALTTLSEGLSKLKSSGWFCLFSGFLNEGLIPANLINEIHYRQVHLVGAYGCTRDQMKRAVGLLDRCQDGIDSLIEETIHLDRVPGILSSVLSGQTFKFIVAF
jgi:L-iditol 2-dehydrogenase